MTIETKGDSSLNKKEVLNSSEMWNFHKDLEEVIDFLRMEVVISNF
jgi:hypothetical protein